MSYTELDEQNQFQREVGLPIWGIYYVAVFGALILVPLVLVQYGYSAQKVFLATILIGVCLYPTARYFAHKEVGLPAFPVLCLAYAFQFAVPIFTREPIMQLVHGQIAYLDDEDVITALLLSLLGVFALLIGYYGSQARNLVKHIPAIGLHIDEKKVIVYCILVCISIPFLAKAHDILSEELYLQLSALIRVLQNQALVAIAILGCLIYQGRGRVWYRVLLYCIIVLSVLQGLATGFIEQTIIPIAALFIIQWQVTKRLPLASIIAVVLIFIFLSPVKHEYRRAMWFEETAVADSSVDRAWLWARQASQYWKDTFSGERSFVESTEQAASRTDLIHQFALIYSMTPSEVPYQYGATYSYFWVTLVPRAIWPEKPLAGSANKFYAVTYGVTTEEGAERSTFGVSLLAESFINFGWIGIILIMALQGAIFNMLQHMFGEQQSGAGGQAVYVAFFVFFLNGIGSSAEILFGNILQSILVGCAILWLIRAKTSPLRTSDYSLLVKPPGTT